MQLHCTVSAASVSLLAALKHSATVAGLNPKCPHPIVGKAIDDMLSFTAVFKHSAIKSCNICHKKTFVCNKRLILNKLQQNSTGSSVCHTGVEHRECLVQLQKQFWSKTQTVDANC